MMIPIVLLKLMNMSMRQAINCIALCVLFFLAGFAIIVIIRNWNQLDFDFKVPVVDVLTLGITVFLAWWVAGKLERDQSEERFEKELLIKKYEELDNQLVEFKKWIDGDGTFLATLMDGTLTELRKLAYRIETELRNRYKKESSKVLKNGSLPVELTILKRLCTFIPETNNSDEIILVDEEYCYEADRLQQIDAVILRIRDIILRQELLLNRLTA